MLKTIPLLVLLTLPGMSPHKKECSCRPAARVEVPRGANEAVEFEAKPVHRLAGRVTFDSGQTPAEGAVVEVFGDTVMGLSAYHVARSGRRRAACVTGADGRFCFAGLPPGKYVLRAGVTSGGVNETHVRVTLLRPRRGRRPKPDKGIEINLTPGT